jgi:hypothetical protein
MQTMHTCQVCVGGSREACTCTLNTDCALTPSPSPLSWLLLSSDIQSERHCCPSCKPRAPGAIRQNAGEARALHQEPGLHLLWAACKCGSTTMPSLICEHHCLLLGSCAFLTQLKAGERRFLLPFSHSHGLGSPALFTCMHGIGLRNLCWSCSL